MDFRLDGRVLHIAFDTYKDNGRIAVLVRTSDSQHFGVLSCNVKEAILLPDEFLAKVWSENEELVLACAHLFENTGKTLITGHCVAPVWRIKHKKLSVIIHMQTYAVAGLFDTAEKAMAYRETLPEAHMYLVMTGPHIL